VCHVRLLYAWSKISVKLREREPFDLNTQIKAVHPELTTTMGQCKRIAVEKLHGNH